MWKKMGMYGDKLHKIGKKTSVQQSAGEEKKGTI